MGRYYNGDIEGKFWVGVQSSDDGEFFGAEALDHDYVPYCADDLAAAEEGLRKCESVLGTHRAALDAFFATHDYYNDTELAAVLGVTGAAAHELLVWYARRELGVKIRDCIKDRGACEFTADI
jgi:hypothetical protein